MKINNENIIQSTADQKKKRNFSGKKEKKTFLCALVDILFFFY